MITTNPVRAGDTFTSVRTIGVEEVRGFADLSGDHAAQHRADGGRLPDVHGLHLVSMPFALASRFDFVGTSLSVQAHAPARAGQPLTSHLEVTEVAEQSGVGWRVALDFDVTDHRGRVILTGSARGMVFDA